MPGPSPYSDSEAIAAVMAAPVRKRSTQTIRLCTLVDPRPYARPWGMTAREEADYYALLGFARPPTDDDIIEDHLDGVFEEDPGGRADRYTAKVRALYTSLEQMTAKAEMRHHSRDNFFISSFRHMSFNFSIIAVTFAGRIRDIRDVCRRNKKLREGSDLKFCQKIGGLALENADAIVVRSVRSDGDNQATVTRATVSSGGILGEFTVEVFRRTSGRYTRIR